MRARRGFGYSVHGAKARPSNTAIKELLYLDMMHRLKKPSDVGKGVLDRYGI